MPSSVIARPAPSEKPGDGEREGGDPQRQPEHEVGEVPAHRGEAGDRREARVGGGEICHSTSLTSHEASSHVEIPPVPVRSACSAPTPDYGDTDRGQCAWIGTPLLRTRLDGVGFRRPRVLHAGVLGPPRDRAPAPAPVPARLERRARRRPGARPPHRLRVRRRLPGRHAGATGPTTARRPRTASSCASTAPAAPPCSASPSTSPPARRTPRPSASPRRRRERTDGTSPAVVELYVYCWDYENDTIVVDGGGPGEHLDGPRTVHGGDGGGADVAPWHYRTAIARGEEATTFWATDDLGARSADTPLTVQVGPEVDRLPDLRAQPRLLRPRGRLPPDLRPARRDPALRPPLLRRRPRPADRAAGDAAGPRRADHLRPRRPPGPCLGLGALGRRGLPARRRVGRARSVHRRRRLGRPHDRDPDGDRQRRRAPLVQGSRVRERRSADDGRHAGRGPHLLRRRRRRRPDGDGDERARARRRRARR